jgi:alkylation response protein AidB-like acyl-CoA dehydrogenase
VLAEFVAAGLGPARPLEEQLHGHPRLPCLDEDSRALQDTLRGFLAGQLSPAALRSSLDTDTGYDAQLDAKLATELGLAGLTIPEEFGGLGMSQAEAGVVHTELGRALYPGPFLAGGLVAGALLEAADQTAARYWLPRLADGSVTGTVAAAGEDGRWSPGSDSRHARGPAIRLFGGIGFTWEHDARLYYRRAWSAERLARGPHARRAAIADIAGLFRCGSSVLAGQVASAIAPRLGPHHAGLEYSDGLGPADPGKTRIDGTGHRFPVRDRLQPPRHLPDHRHQGHR